MNNTENRPQGPALALSLLFYALAIWLTAVRARPPKPKPASVPASDFSATRARTLLRVLVGDNVPHPVGSAENRAVRGRVVVEFARLGYQPKIDSGFACDTYGNCAQVKNVVARWEGQEPGPAVLLSAHYDSVPAGPGASDDGASVASVLEVARALKASPPLRHSVIFLIDDGEEAGLLGAEAFVDGDPWAKDVRADVNLEARGTSGPSMMFETGNANDWLMRLYAHSVSHPDTSSIYYEAYKRMPNDTDFTVFKRVGFQGFNFAFIGDVAHYHTPLDNFANANPASIQQQGDNALAAVRALANSDLNPPGPSNAVFFDLFGWKTIYWPAGETVICALLATLLVAVEIIFLVARRRLPAKEFFLGFASWPAMLFASGIAGGILQFLFRRGGALPVNWVAHPGPMLFVFWMVGFAAIGYLAIAFSRGASFWGFWGGIWIWWSIVALALAVVLPGASYVCLIPALAAGLFALPAIFLKADRTWTRNIAAIIPAVVAISVGCETVWFLYDALGAVILAGITVMVALLATPLAPMVGGVSKPARWKFPNAALAGVVVGSLIALFLPVYSAASPQRLNLEYLEEATGGQARWLAVPASGQLPKSFRQATNFTPEPEAVFPWESPDAYGATAQGLNLPPPVLSVVKVTPTNTKVTYLVRLLSPRGAREIAMVFPPDSGVQMNSIGGHAVPRLNARLLRFSKGWLPYTCLTVPAEGIEMQFTLPNRKPVKAFLIDRSFGLPLDGAFLQKARPTTTIPSQDGDVTLVSRQVSVQETE